MGKVLCDYCGKEIEVYYERKKVPVTRIRNGVTSYTFENRLVEKTNSCKCSICGGTFCQNCISGGFCPECIILYNKSQEDLDYESGNLDLGYEDEQVLQSADKIEKRDSISETTEPDKILTDDLNKNPPNKTRDDFRKGNKQNNNSKRPPETSRSSDTGKRRKKREPNTATKPQALIFALIIIVSLSTLFLYSESDNEPSFFEDEKEEYSYKPHLLKASGEPIILEDNRSAHDPTWDEMIAFLKADDTDRIRFENDSFICADFAERLHNNAEKKGINAAIVSVDFENQEKGHVFNAFNTTDKGLTYVDCTGSTAKAGALDNFDKIAYIEVGNEYGIVAAYFTNSPDYEFYDLRKNKKLKGFYDSLGVVKYVKIYWDINSFESSKEKYSAENEESKKNIQVSNSVTTQKTDKNKTSYYLDIAGADGHVIHLENNPEAQNPTYERLIRFLKNDDTDRIMYESNKFVCADFAENLHNNAEKVGISAAYISIDFEDSEYGHALNAFATTDKGLVYIDCTGNTEKTSSFEKNCFDKIAYLEIGKEYGIISIHETDDTRYWYWETYKDRGRSGYYYPQGIVKNIQVYW